MKILGTYIPRVNFNRSIKYFLPRLYLEPRHKNLQKLQKCHRVFLCLVCTGTKVYSALSKVQTTLVELYH